MRESIPSPFTLSLNLNLSLAVGVAQGLERLAVAQEVAGSKPVTHPKFLFQFLGPRLRFGKPPEPSCGMSWPHLVAFLRSRVSSPISFLSRAFSCYRRSSRSVCRTTSIALVARAIN